MDLVTEDFDMVRHLEFALKVLDGVLGLLLGGQQDIRHGYLIGHSRVDHGWMSNCRNTEDVGRARGHELDGLATPAKLYIVRILVVDRDSNASSTYADDGP